MKRNIDDDLYQWKTESNRRPLLIRGARQVGKTYAVRQLGRSAFTHFVELNFEKNPEYREIFTSVDPSEMIEKIALFTRNVVKPGQTLLFLDEIQECPRAITALRYFFEDMPQLHVIAAGSLVEFMLQAENIHVPVGRIQYLYMFPMSFGEFLVSQDESTILDHIRHKVTLQRLPNALHERLLDYVRKYFILGGMPAVVQEFFDTMDIKKCQRIQHSIIETYIDDFGKYAKKVKHRYLQKVFAAVPKMVGQKFVYANVDSNIKSRELKEALELLEMAGVVTRIKSTSGAGLPMQAGEKENYFKVLFLDVGLMHAANGIYDETVQAKDFTDIFKGAIAEQFVGQQLLAYQTPYTKPALHYWVREARNSKAEVDYLIAKMGKIIPVEIKSGTTGRMKSLHLFLKTFQSDFGIKISQERYVEQPMIKALPFYAIEGLVKNDLI